MTIKQSALVVKFIEGNDNFDNYTSEQQEREIGEYNLSNYNKLIPVWQDCMNIIEEHSLDTRLKKYENEMIQCVKTNILYDIDVLRKAVLEFIEWWSENKKWFKK